MILCRDEIGQQMFEVFVTECLTEGKLSVWDKITKMKLGTYKTANASTKIKVGDSMVKIKEERGLLQRFIVISRSRPELDLKECIGTYEFGVVPRSLFASDGYLLLAYDKASILQHLEKLSSNAQQVEADRNKATESEPSINQSISASTTTSSILDALAMLGNDSDLPSDACSQLEGFVCVLYRSNIHTTVKELRWFLYSNRAAEGENLSPTSGSLDLHKSNLKTSASARRISRHTPSLSPGVLSTGR